MLASKPELWTSSRDTTVKGAALAWALAGAVRFAVATAVVALVLSTFVQDTDAERFASTAYLALTFAAILLIAKWFVPAGRDERPESLRIPTLPVLLASLLGLAAVLAAGAGLVADPSAEVRTLAYCLAAVGVAAIGRSGAFPRLHATLARGDRLEATIRYATLFSVAALLLASQLPQQIGDVIAAFAYGGSLVAAVALASVLVAPTPLGSRVRNAYGDGLRTIEELSSDLVFARMIDVSVVTMVASIAMASLLRPPYFGAVRHGCVRVGPLRSARRRDGEPAATGRRAPGSGPTLRSCAFTRPRCGARRSVREGLDGRARDPLERNDGGCGVFNREPSVAAQRRAVRGRRVRRDDRYGRRRGRGVPAVDPERAVTTVTRLAGKIALAAAFAAFVIAKGVPALRHDWNWPLDRLAVPSFLNESISGWLSVGFGIANSHPTTYLLAAPTAVALWLFGTLVALSTARVRDGILRRDRSRERCVAVGGRAERVRGRRVFCAL